MFVFFFRERRCYRCFVARGRRYFLMMYVGAALPKQQVKFFRVGTETDTGHITWKKRRRWELSWCRKNRVFCICREGEMRQINLSPSPG